MLAVPLHGDDVAPRFCSADEFMIAELDRDQVRRIRRLGIRVISGLAGEAERLISAFLRNEIERYRFLPCRRRRRGRDGARRQRQRMTRSFEKIEEGKE